MSSCFILPSDFDPDKFSGKLRKALGNPGEEVLPDNKVDYSTPPVFSDPMPISGIELAVKHAEFPESYFVTFSTKSVRIDQEYKEQMNEIHTLWDKLMIQKQKPEPHQRLDSQRFQEYSDSIYDVNSAMFMKTQYYTSEAGDNYQNEEEDDEESQPLDFAVSTTNSINRPFMQSLMIGQSQANNEMNSNSNEPDQMVYQMSISRAMRSSKISPQ